MDTLRLILIVIGALILAAMVLFHRPAGESKRNHARWLNSRREPSLGDLDEDLDEASSPTGDDRPSSRPPDGAGALSGSLRPARPERPASAANLAAGLASARIIRDDSDDMEAESKGSDQARRGHRQGAPDKIVTLYVQRKQDRRLGGNELHDAARKAGLDFGEMNIFHRLHEGASEPVFSMANLTAPGHFDPAHWSSFDTPGVTFFLTLPAPVSALDAWDAMLATARRMAELLDAEVLDDARCQVSRQRIAQMRDEMRDYDRKHGLGSGF
ncbi:MAG: cell division protein ZipA [Wenzhouxiangella sp.]